MKLTVLSLGLALGFGAMQNDALGAGKNGESFVYTVATADYQVITIKKGDTLYSLAKKYKTTVATLQKMNNLKTTKILVGKKLKVPAADTTATGDISLTLQKGYILEKEEPGKNVLLYKEDMNYFVRIEVLDNKANLDAVKKEATEYLKATGKVHAIDPNQTGHKFYKGAKFYLHASNSKVSQNLVVKKVGSKLVKFTIHFRNTEASEGITPYMLDILATAK
jgi:LysM repeat protein